MYNAFVKMFNNMEAVSNPVLVYILSLFEGFGLFGYQVNFRKYTEIRRTVSLSAKDIVDFDFITKLPHKRLVLTGEIFVSNRKYMSRMDSFDAPAPSYNTGFVCVLKGKVLELTKILVSESKNLYYQTYSIDTSDKRSINEIAYDLAGDVRGVDKRQYKKETVDDLIMVLSALMYFSIPKAREQNTCEARHHECKPGIPGNPEYIVYKDYDTGLILNKNDDLDWRSKPHMVCAHPRKGRWISEYWTHQELKATAHPVEFVRKDEFMLP